MFSGLSFLVLLLSFVVLTVLMTPSLLEGLMDRLPDAILDKKIFMAIYAVLLCAVLYPVILAISTYESCDDCKANCANQAEQETCVSDCKAKYGAECLPPAETES